ncbi:MAG: cobalamin biosynthesis protein CobW [Clostridia bacterium]|nr:cobalamin biosynthesis protein CobW [Clostridia bacterium]
MTKIDIFSGFLGAGKTTLIKKLLKEAYTGEQVVLIENEFGEIGIDGGFLSEAGINITEMNSGCICCSLVGDFTKALAQVLEQYHPDRILIEPSGVGKLSDVVRAVSSVLTETVVLNCLCAVADANKCKMYAKNFGEFYIDQIRNATSIILSHTGGISDKKIADAVALLRENNETATIVTTPWELLDGKAILETMEHKDTLHAAMKALEKEHHEHHHHDHDEECECGHHHHDHDEECECGHHHHDHDEECECGHHHHEHDEKCECGHHHHDHDEECECGHHHHEHDEKCECGRHHHDHDEKCGCGHDHHHHHHADEVFQSFGRETTKKYTKEGLLSILETFSEDPAYGMVLRAKGIVAAEDGTWLHFDYVPGEPDVRIGGASVIGRLCVIGAGIDEHKLTALFGLDQ